MRPDLVSPHKFRFDPPWPGCTWVGQRITDGLTIIRTILERDGQRCELEHFSAPLHDTPPTKRGETASVFLTQARFTGSGSARFDFRLSTENTNRHPQLRGQLGRHSVVDCEKGATWLIIGAANSFAVAVRLAIHQEKDPRLESHCMGELEARVTSWIVLMLA